MRLNALYFVLIISSMFKHAISNECGRVLVSKATKLIRGQGFEKVYHGQFPWLVPIFRDDAYICGSSLISNKHVLTAAHCVIEAIPPDFYVLLGRYNLADDSEPHFIRRTISQMYAHESFNFQSTQYQSDGDIAILKLKDPIKFTNYIQPVCLPNAGDRTAGLSGFTAGYGKYNETTEHINIPISVRLETISDSDCLYEGPNYVTVVSKRSFCARHPLHSTAPCQGDSGGGFFTKKFVDSTEYSIVYGIVSHALDGMCRPTDYTVYTDVTKYLDWINEKMADTSEYKSIPCKSLECGEKEDCISFNGKEFCKCKKSFMGLSPNCFQCHEKLSCNAEEECRHGICVPSSGVSCEQISCGPFAFCDDIGGVGVCSCRFGIHPRCRRYQCEDNEHCLFNEVCSSEGECKRPCELDPCSTNAICKQTKGREYKCTCKPGYHGNPYQFCEKSEGFRETPTEFECKSNDHCKSDEICKDKMCKKPCDLDPCGRNAICTRVTGNIINCVCKPGYEGDPFESCLVATTTRAAPLSDPCRMVDCGPFSQCRIRRGVTICSCFPDHLGQPPNCRKPPKSTTTSDELDVRFADVAEHTTAASKYLPSYCLAEFCKANAAKCSEGNTKCNCEVKNEMDCHCNCDTVTTEKDDKGGSTTLKKNFQWFLEW